MDALLESPPAENLFALWKSLLEQPLSAHGGLPRTTAVARACMELLSNGPQALDFAALDPKLASALGLATSLRCSNSWRGAIPTWEHGLLMAIDAAAREGLDARALLRGLL